MINDNIVWMRIDFHKIIIQIIYVINIYTHIEMISYLGKLWTKGSGRFVLESTILAIEDDDGPLMSHKSHMNLSLCHL